MKQDLLSATMWKTRIVLWLGAILVGAAAALFAWSSSWIEELREVWFERIPWLPLVITPLGIMIVVWITRHWVPGARGSGIPQAIAALQNPDEKYRSGLLSFRIAFAKLVLTLIGLGAGASIGREGPTVHIGASIMFRLGRFAKFPHHLLERGLILAGGAAGISAAFNTPIAGIMFAIEEMARSFEERSSGAVITAVVLAGVFAMATLGNYNYFGQTDAAIEGLGGWLAVPVCGIAGGLLGGLFSEALIQGSRRLVPVIKRAPMRFACLTGILLALLGMMTDGSTFGTGYHDSKAILLGVSDASVWYPFLKMLASWLSYFTGIPGGIFAPSLAIGAGMGADLAPLVPTAPVAAVVLLGMVAYFTGVMQTPITAAVIVMEMTDNQGMILPILATAFLAMGASKLVCRKSVFWALSDDLLERFEEKQRDPDASQEPDPPEPAKVGADPDKGETH